MTNILKITGGVIAGIVIGLVISAVFRPAFFGGVYNTVAPNLGAGATIGQNGTKIGDFIYGTCYLAADFSISATSTGMVDCVSSSFRSGDTVIIGGFATSSTSLTRQFSILGTGNASSTNGYAPVRVTNWTGAAVIPTSLGGFGSSTPFLIIRP